MVHKTTSHLRFDQQTEQAARLFSSIFPNSTFGEIGRYVKAVSVFVRLDLQRPQQAYEG